MLLTFGFVRARVASVCVCPGCRRARMRSVLPVSAPDVAVLVWTHVVSRAVHGAVQSSFIVVVIVIAKPHGRLDLDLKLNGLIFFYSYRLAVAIISALPALRLLLLLALASATHALELD